MTAWVCKIAALATLALLSGGSAVERGASATINRNVASAVRVETYLEPLYPGPARADKCVSGSGTLISSDGLVLACEHTVSRAKSVVVCFSDGTRSPGKIVAVDPVLDLALLRAQTVSPSAEPLNVGQWHRPQVGEEITFCASPLGLPASTLFGWVSALDRRLGKRWLPRFQIQAIASGGASGAAVTDLHGNFIGVLHKHAIQNPSIGFLIPADIVDRFVDQGRQGTAGGSWTGMQVGFDEENGTWTVRETECGGPADIAGLIPGDCLQTVEGHPPGEAFAAGWDVWQYFLPCGRSVRMDVVRNGRPREIVMIPRYIRYRCPQQVFVKHRGVVVAQAHFYSPYAAGAEDHCVVIQVVDVVRANGLAIGDVIAQEETHDEDGASSDPLSSSDDSAGRTDGPNGTRDR